MKIKKSELKQLIREELKEQFAPNWLTLLNSLMDKFTGKIFGSGISEKEKTMLKTALLKWIDKK